MWWALVVLGISWLGACASAGVPFCEGGPPGDDAASGYRLGPGDRIRVTVFGQPDLSGEHTVDGEGYIVVPLAGAIAAAGLTTHQLADEIARRLQSSGFLVDPSVIVQLVAYRPIYVLGEVDRPGSYEFREGMTVTNAVALAGGYTYRADRSAVTIERGGCRFAAQQGARVAPGDVITVPERLF